MSKRGRGHDPRAANRMARVGELVRRIVAEAMDDLDDDRLAMVSITSVEVDRDLNRAIVWFTTLDGDDDPAVREAFADHRGRLRRAVGDEARLRYRRGSDATNIYPDVARALGALPFGDLVLDGELVVLDEDSRPSFQRLQKRAQQRRAIDIQRATLELPATLYVFDLLAFEGFDVRPLPLVERKRLVQMLLPGAGPIHPL